MKTITILIGNSDDKLTQRKWSEYVTDFNVAIRSRATQIYFYGTSENTQPWQNACWVIEILSIDALYLLDRLTEIRQKYLQDSFAYTVSESRFG